MSRERHIICDICGKSSARIRRVTRSYGKGANLLVILLISLLTSCRSTLVPPMPPQTPEPLRFTGHGQQVSETFMLTEGLVIFRMTHDGSSNFAVVLLDDKGKWIELLVNKIGKFDGAKAVGIKRAGKYLLDIQADGNWTISVEQPSAPANAPTPPLTFTGRGQQISPMFRLADSLVTFHMTHDGSSNFAIVLLDDKGGWVELLVNKIGDFDGAKAVGIRRAGVYLLNITADGNWVVTIKQ